MNLLFRSSKPSKWLSTLNRHRRNYLSDSFFCKGLWDQRLSGIEARIDTSNLMLKVYSDLENNVPVSALDFDILMCRIDDLDDSFNDYTKSVIKNYRRTQESLSAFDSTSHSIGRNLLAKDEIDFLYELIRTRSETGVFLDAVTVTMLLEQLSDSEDWLRAGLVSAEWLFQEQHLEPAAAAHNSVHSLAVAACLRALLEWWRSGLWHRPDPDSSTSASKKQQIEYKFMKYLKTSCFDDHFDLLVDDDSWRRRVLGKCLRMSTDFLLGSQKTEEAACDLRQLRLLGLALHERLDQLIIELGQWIQTDTQLRFSSSLVASIVELIETAERTDTKKDDEITLIYKTHTEEEIQICSQKFKELVADHVDEDGDPSRSCLEWLERIEPVWSESAVPDVTELLQSYRSHREAEFNRTHKLLEATATLQKTKERLLKLTEEEELISYFKQLPQIQYQAWLAKRTKVERSYSAVKSMEENLDNIKKKQKKKFVIQHDPQ